MISVQNAKVVFAKGTSLEKTALDGLNLSISEGEFVTVIGPNGAGKSTLFSVLAGDVALSEGSLKIGGRTLQHKDFSKNVSRVFQDPQMGTCAQLSVAENLALASARGRKRGLRLALRRPDKKAYTQLLGELGLGLESKLDHPMGALSGGQRQAISLFMATLSPLRVLLLDEHTSALDPKTAEVILNLSEKLTQERKLTTFMVTHSLSQALSVGNRTVLVKEGRIAKDWSGRERQSASPSDLRCFIDA